MPPGERHPEGDAANAHPLAISGRDLIILLAFGVILVTLVVQGLSLPAPIQRLGLADPGEVAGAEQEARLAAYRAVLAFLDSEEAPEGVPPEQLARLRRIYEKHIQHVRAHAEATQSSATAAQGDHDPAAAYQQLKRTLLTVPRRAVIALHDQGRLGDESRRRVERTLDLEEAELRPPVR